MALSLCQWQHWQERDPSSLLYPWPPTPPRSTLLWERDGKFLWEKSPWEQYSIACSIQSRLVAGLGLCPLGSRSGQRFAGRNSLTAETNPARLVLPLQLTLQLGSGISSWWGHVIFSLYYSTSSTVSFYLIIPLHFIDGVILSYHYIIPLHFIDDVILSFHYVIPLHFIYNHFISFILPLHPLRSSVSTYCRWSLTQKKTNQRQQCIERTDQRQQCIQRTDQRQQCIDRELTKDSNEYRELTKDSNVYRELTKDSNVYRERTDQRQPCIERELTKDSNV